MHAYMYEWCAQHLEGVIVALSEEGRLEACYLGAEPSLFIAPPLHRRGFDYKAAENELLELRKQAKNTASSGNYLLHIRCYVTVIIIHSDVFHFFRLRTINKF